MIMGNEVFDKAIMVSLIIGTIVLVILIVITIYTIIDTMKHNSYHKGYNECRNDEVLYYKSLKDLNDSFLNIIRLIDMEGLSFSFKTTSEVMRYKDLLEKYRSKY